MDLEVKLESSRETGKDQPTTMQLLQPWIACTMMLYWLALDVPMTPLRRRIPRCGRRPAKMIKFTLGLQLVFRKQKMFAQSSPVGLHKEAKSLHLVCNWCAGSQKQFALGLPSR